MATFLFHIQTNCVIIDYENRGFESYSHPHSEASKLLIGIKSKEKFTEEFKEKFRETQIALGNWVSDQDRTDFEIYKMHAGWVRRMWDYAKPGLLEEFGIFNSKTNKSGLVRDHKFSVLHGFQNGIYPEILRHPVNCDVIMHSQNSTKRSNSSITIDELFSGILCYNSIWPEQHIVVHLINDWKSGNRFRADDYRRKSNV